jgi:hypothetical protein
MATTTHGVFAHIIVIESIRQDVAASRHCAPLLAAGGLKIVYDLLLLAYFGKVAPPEERTA